MNNKNQLPIIAVLAAVLAASWGYFYSAQKKADARLNMLIAKMGTSSPATGGKEAVDTYIAVAVKNTLRKHTPDIQKLWLDYLKTAGAKPGGFVEADWQINEDGKVIDAGIIYSEFDSKPLNEGIARIIKKIGFPPPPSGTTTYVSHKFIFKKEP